MHTYSLNKNHYNLKIEYNNNNIFFYDYMRNYEHIISSITSNITNLQLHLNNIIIIPIYYSSNNIYSFFDDNNFIYPLTCEDIINLYTFINQYIKSSGFNTYITYIQALSISDINKNVENAYINREPNFLLNLNIKEHNILYNILLNLQNKNLSLYSQSCNITDLINFKNTINLKKQSIIFNNNELKKCEELLLYISNKYYYYIKKIQILNKFNLCYIKGNRREQGILQIQAFLLILGCICCPLLI